MFFFSSLQKKCTSHSSLIKVSVQEFNQHGLHSLQRTKMLDKKKKTTTKAYSGHITKQEGKLDI